ncbi:Ornithine decarboxylase [Microbotryomycetes sp. JL221]|nr:Ornithine decarboxylase [Microbotryomycetes sp. JL221]
MTAVAIPIGQPQFDDERHLSRLALSLSASPARHHSLLATSPRPSSIAAVHNDDADDKPAPAYEDNMSRSIKYTAVIDGSTKPIRAVQQVDTLPQVHTGTITDNFKTALQDIDLEECEAHGDNAFFVCDLAEVYRQHVRWMRELGHRVQPFFGEWPQLTRGDRKPALVNTIPCPMSTAVKSNPDPYVLRLMSALGLGFDCASQPEISAVLALPHRPEPSRIIYANPCKAASFVRNAAKNGVNYMTFDNGDELVKIKKYHPNAKMVLRILTDDSSSLCRLGLKFGAPLSEVRGLLRKAASLGVNVVGISFHCGSGCKDPSLFGDAIRRARWAFDVGAEEGFNFDLLDIGGGFEDGNFEAIAAVLREAIDQSFPLDAQGRGVRVIAEPGRYYVSRAFQLATNIIARRAARDGINDETSMMDGVDDEQADDDSKPTAMYYINDGVYGAFNCTMFDHQIVHPVVMTLNETFYNSADVDHGLLEECSVWGPTCDSIDVVQPQAKLPVSVLNVGDWLRWENMGAYTICAASQFNGFRKSLVRYTIDADEVVEGKIRALLA